MTLRLYWIGLYEGRESNKWNWFLQVDLAAATIYGTKRIVGGGKHTHMLPTVVLVLMRTNEHTVAGVLFFLDGVFSLITFIIVAWIVFGGGHFHALGTGCLIFGCTVCAITRKKIVAMLVGAISCNVGLPDLLP